MRRMRRPVRLALVSGAVTALALLVAGPAAAEVPVTPEGVPADVDALADYEAATTCAVVQPGTEELRALIVETYGRQVIGGTRACPVGSPVNSEHMDGRALDWMLDSAAPADAATAQEFLTWLVGADASGASAVNARRLGVQYVIWNGMVWKSYRAEAGWQPYVGANPHTDHIHLSLSHRGGAGETSWWTGQTSPVAGHWVALGGSGSALGDPVADSVDFRGGLTAPYENGSVLWSEDTGARAVTGAIAQTYFSGRTARTLGFPLTDELPTPDGDARYNHFEAGSVYWSARTGAHVVRGGIRDAWAAQGWETGALGLPTSGERTTDSGALRVDFEGGWVSWTDAAGAQVHLTWPAGGAAAGHPAR